MTALQSHSSTLSQPHNPRSPIRFCFTLALSCLGSLLPVAIAQPGHSAERIFVTYNILERSIPIASLEAYAEQGTIDDSIAAYAQYADPKILAELRTALRTKADLKPVTVAQFLYSPQGEAALKRLGQVIQPESRISGFKAIRAALILASTDPEGLTLLNFLKKFPTRGIRVDVERSLRIVGELEGLINQSRKATQVITQLAQTEAATDPVPSPTRLDLRQTGPFAIQKLSITLNDPNRRAAALPTAPTPPTGSDIVNGRTYPVDIYLPQPANNVLPPTPTPVVVISHGLGSDLTSFVYLANHLASHGFAVLVPEHPGSNREQMEALLEGVASEVSEPIEFVNRPLDISYLLDYLEREAATNPTYRSLNLKQVGVIGQSFGGYTALALAGAPINFQQLQKSCLDLENTFNLSLLLQCRAQALQQLGTPRTDFRDPRVAAVIAMNPIDSAVLGPDHLSLIKLPTLIVAGSADTVAPALFEQVQPFTWLTTTDKYLVQMDPGTHFSVIGGGELGTGAGALALPPEVIGPNPAIAQRYINALALAFFQTHIAQQDFRNYLTAAYVRSISEPGLRVDLVRTLTPSQLATGNKPKPSGG